MNSVNLSSTELLTSSNMSSSAMVTVDMSASLKTDGPTTPSLFTPTKPRHSSPALKAMLFVLEKISSISVLATILTGVFLLTPHVPWFLMGMYLCGYAAKIIQRILRQGRPIQSDKTSYGMPSAHASAICFLGSYVVLTSTFVGLHPRLKPSTWFFTFCHIVGSSVSSSTRSSFNFSSTTSLSTSSPFTNYLRQIDQISNGVLSFLAICLSISVCWSRHYFGHHTLGQIMAGVVFGTSCALCWFSLWQVESELFLNGFAFATI